tara:strand:+ start:258 stop:659 length:402 start_codon:yes stop_codon:yes gene_type:complete
MKYILILLIFFSCSPIKRHSRIVKKFPYVHTIDSIKLIDTIKVTTNKVEYDTVIHERMLFDTITLTKDNLTVRVLKIRDSIYINAQCDTIFIDKIIERNIPIKYYKEDSFNWWILYLIGALIIFTYIWKNIPK